MPPNTHEAGETEDPTQSGVAAILGLGLGFLRSLPARAARRSLKGTEDVEDCSAFRPFGLIPAVTQTKATTTACPSCSNTPRFLRQRNGNAVSRRRRGIASMRKETKRHVGRSVSWPASVDLAFHRRSSAQLVVVTSTQPAEGKTTIARTWQSLSPKSAAGLACGCRFAVTFAARLFGMRENLVWSATHWPSGLAPVVRPSDPGSRSPVCGPIPPNPSELLSSRSMGELIRSARNNTTL